ncbi:MAG: hypothetical protein QOJ04_351, partial [Caballeronia sp.]|nr:hypothetical protein [Caballeronia sp.]
EQVAAVHPGPLRHSCFDGRGGNGQAPASHQRQLVRETLTTLRLTDIDGRSFTTKLDSIR